VKHPYHIVDARPWPLTGAAGALFLLTGLCGNIHKINSFLILFGLIVIIFTISQWWRDVMREASFQGKHTDRVENGLRLGILLFIISELFLFFAFFWAFFHSSLRPNIEVGSTWPPVMVIPIGPYEVPLLNTTILLSSGATITWAHLSLINSKWLEAHLRFAITVGLGTVFTLLQVIEYKYSSFSIADSVYGRVFFLATGFHGIHVVFGTIFISTMWRRHICGHFSESHHFGFEGRAWYWHFVDVVWLFLFICVYWWGC